MGPALQQQHCATVTPCVCLSVGLYVIDKIMQVQMSKFLLQDRTRILRHVVPSCAETAGSRSKNAAAPAARVACVKQATMQQSNV